MAVWLTLIIVASAARAQSAAGDWRTFNALDGVSAHWVFDIVQTPDNALWFATDAGVLRFDGAWRAMDQGRLASPALSLAVDAAGDVWAGAAHGVARWTGDAWEMQGAGTELAEAVINDLMALPNGDLLAGSPHGLFAWSPEAGWRRITGLPAAGVDHMALDARQGLWLAQAATLYRQEDAGWRAFTLGDPADGFRIMAMAPDDRGGMWVATEARGIVHVTDWEMVWESAESGLPDDQVLALLIAADGALWAGVRGGVARLDQRGWETFTRADGLAADTVSALFQDSDGVFWFGATAGVTRYDPTSWQTWHSPPAPDEDIVALALDEDGVWAAEAGGSLYRLQGNAWRQVALPTEGDAQRLSDIETLFLDQKGALWIGTRTQGVIAFDGRQTQQWRMEDGLAENFVTAIAQTPDGVMWFGTRTGGLSRFDGHRWQGIAVEEGLLSNEITALLADSEGALWVGEQEGIQLFDGTTWRAFASEDGMDARAITALAQDENGAVWAATWEGELSRWKDGVWETIDAPGDVAPFGVNALLATSGRVWIGALNGLSVYDGRWLQSFHPDSNNVGPVHALVGNDDALYLGGKQGVVRLRLEKTPPALTMLMVNGGAPQRGVIPANANAPMHILLQAGDIHTSPSELVRLIRIKGVDNDWRQTRNPLIVYPALPPGDYLIQAQVRDPYMNYSRPMTATLRVRRPLNFAAIIHRDLNQPGLALISVALLMLLVAAAGYALWTMARRWRSRQQAIESHFNPYIAGSPIRTRNMFFGRTSILSHLKASLAHNSMILYGERRIGKTSLLYRLREELPQVEDKKFHFFPVYVNLEGASAETFFHRLMEGLLVSLREPLADFPAKEKLQYFMLSQRQMTYTDRHMRRDLRQIIGHLKKPTEPTPRIIFLLDEADALSGYDSRTQQQFRRILQDVFAHNVGAVIAGVYISKAWDRMESPWYNMFVEVNVPPLGREEAEQLMRRPVWGVYDWEDAAVEFVWQRTGGRPHRIQQLAREAINLMLNDRRRRITLEDVRQAYARVVFAEPGSYS